MKYIPLFFIFVLLFSCVPPEKKGLKEVNIDLSDSKVQRLITHQIDQNVDSLLFYLNSENPSYRFLAAQAFCSFQDSTATDELIKKLNDQNIKIRAMASFALAQIGNKNMAKEVMSHFKQRDTISVDNIANAKIIESMGSLGNPNILNSLVTVSTYRPTDTLLLVAQTRAIYKLSLQGITNPKATSLMVQYINAKELPDEARLYAAHYLARTNDLDIEQVKFQIANQLVKEKNVNIKMALALALRHTQDQEIQSILNEELNIKNDYRVVVNIIRALNAYDYINSVEKIIELVNHENQHIATAAIQYLGQSGNKEDAGIYREVAMSMDSSLLKPKLYNSFFKSIPYYYTKTRNAARYDIQQQLEKENNDRMIAAYMDALSEDINSYELIYKNAEESDNPVILTAATRALGKILNNERFNANFKSSTRYARRKIIGYIQELFLKKDVGVYTEGSLALATENSMAKQLLDSLNFLLDAKENLDLPKDLEAGQAIIAAINFLSDTLSFEAPKSTKVKKLNFQILENIKDSTTAIIKTNKGVFNIKFFTKEAPSSVVNFVELAEDNYYDGKIFNRVVPNFVIQTGCPRGDGYGSLDYTIRSELSGSYYNDEGYVGMASAGLHTESTQWFVTHSPTPHLDGRYTIFGKISEGMDVVHSITEGDEILDIIITNK